MRIKRIQDNEVVKKDSAQPDLALLDPIIYKYKGYRGNLIPLLQGVQQTFGYLPKAAFHKIARETGLPLNELYGVATFYAQFRLNPVGKNIIKVCHGTACHVQNASSITTALEERLKIKNGESTPDLEFTLESVACLGCCSLAPVMMIGDDTFGKLTGKSAGKAIDDIEKNKNN
ncbi:MAG: NADH-quinone oxidoreductase subunit NuoE [Cyclobacteriaceae bacterium]